MIPKLPPALKKPLRAFVAPDSLEMRWNEYELPLFAVPCLPMLLRKR